jgi:alkylated DNA repair dioxygenase AlkB
MLPKQRNSRRQQQQHDLRAFFGTQEGEAINDSKAWKSRKRPRPGASKSAGGSAFGSCPLCGDQFPWHKLEAHAATCEGESPPQKQLKSSKEKEQETILEERNQNDYSQVKSVVDETIEFPITNDAQSRSHGKKVDDCANQSSLTPTKMVAAAMPDCFTPLKATSEPIQGLYLYEDFVTEEEEQRILATLDDSSRQDFLPWKSSNFNGNHLGKRWGVHCNLRTRQVTDAENPLPWFVMDILVPKIKELHLPAMERVSWVPNEANAIDYHRRQGHYLKNHVDDRKLSKEPIANLSLAGDCYMTFRNEKIVRAKMVDAPANYNRNKGNSEQLEEKRVLLKRRCLQVLTGKVRYDFSHGIRHADLLSDRRVSLTMRESPLTNGNGKNGHSKPTGHHQPTLRTMFQNESKQHRMKEGN